MAFILAKATARGRYFIPQSGATTTRFASTWASVPSTALSRGPPHPFHGEEMCMSLRRFGLRLALQHEVTVRRRLACVGRDRSAAHGASVTRETALDIFPVGHGDAFNCAAGR